MNANTTKHPMVVTDWNGKAPTKITRSPDDNNERNGNRMGAQASTAPACQVIHLLTHIAAGR